MKIRMTRTVQGSLDGVTVRELVAGEEYETVDSPRGARLALYHLRQGVAVAPVTVPAQAGTTKARKARRSK